MRSPGAPPPCPPTRRARGGRARGGAAPRGRGSRSCRKGDACGVRLSRARPASPRAGPSSAGPRAASPRQPPRTLARPRSRRRPPTTRRRRRIRRPRRRRGRACRRRRPRGCSRRGPAAGSPCRHLPRRRMYRLSRRAPRRSPARRGWRRRRWPETASPPASAALLSTRTRGPSRRGRSCVRAGRASSKRLFSSCASRTAAGRGRARRQKNPVV